jgi:tRNA G46 methylase TrmB
METENNKRKVEIILLKINSKELKNFCLTKTRLLQIVKKLENNNELSQIDIDTLYLNNINIY